LLLIFFLSVRLGLFPATGWQPLSDGLVENLQSAFLPARALSVTNIAVFTRLLRTDMITTLQEDHVTLARSKGLPTWRIL
ncbi:ABC transporter permease subunit, partial [Enterococcus faecium]